MKRLVAGAALIATIAMTMSAGLSSAGAADPAAADARTIANKYADSDMHMMCTAMNESHAWLDHVFIDGQFVLAGFHCGKQPGWATFKLEGELRTDKSTVAINGKLDTAKLMRIGMDNATANRLIGSFKAVTTH